MSFTRGEKMNIGSDVKLEKALDMMLQEVEGMKNIEDCPLYRWMNDFRVEEAEENIANLKTEISVPSFDEETCGNCPVEE